jgi:hypothetical protein
MASMTDRSSAGLGFMSEGFSLALIYAIAFVTTLALRSAQVDGWKLFVPAVAFAALAGPSLKRFPDQRPVLLALAASALATGVAVGLT